MKRILLILVLGMILVSGCKKEDINPIPQVNIDQKVIDELEKNTEVRVIVSLRGTNNLTLPSIHQKEEREEVMQKITKNNLDMEDKVLSELSESEFKVLFKFDLTPSFSGYITKEGLEKLRKSSDVETIQFVGKEQGAS